MSDANPADARAAIEVREVVRNYGDHAALNGLTLSVPEGSIFGVLGPNGSGKSTLLSLLVGRSTPDSGVVTVFGRTPGATTRAETGVVFQESTLDPLGTASDNLELSGRLFGLSRGQCRERGEALLNDFGLPGRYHAAVQTLSGGMRRRVEIARALLHKPRLLLMDEPTTGIDPEEREVVWDRLRRFVADGATVVLATNDLREAERVCTDAAFLQHGRVVGAGTPETLKSGLRRESIIIEWAGSPADAINVLRNVDGVVSADMDEKTVQLAVDDASVVAPRLFAAAGGAIVGLRIRQATLEDAYFQHVARRTSQAETDR